MLEIVGRPGPIHGMVESRYTLADTRLNLGEEEEGGY